MSLKHLALLAVGAAGAAALAACSSVDTDTRPRANGYITPTMLGPLCGKTECHSTFGAEEGYVLDTTHGVTTTLRYELEKVGPDSHLINNSPDPSGQPLRTILNIRGAGFDYQGNTPMPYDSPMSDADAEYLLDFLAQGAPGACDPALATFCYPLSGQRVSCGPDNQYVFTSDPSCN